SVPAVEIRSVPAVESRSVPAVETRSVPAVEIRSVPAVESRSVPAVETRSVPAVEIRSVPAVKTGSVPAVEIRSVPAVETRSVPTAMLLQNKTTSPALVKAIEEIYVTCGGLHPYYECLAIDGNTFNAFAAIGTYNQGGQGYRPQGETNYHASNQMRPPGFPQTNV
nr:hypothetical protein [Tanacetum cinerariifolium]